METTQDNLSHNDSMLIIQKMIGSARNSFTDNGTGWLIWGSMIFVASISTFFLIEFEIQPTFLAWNIFGLISIILLTVQVFRPTKRKVVTYTEEVLSYVEKAFIICLFIVIFSMNVSVSPNDGFGFLLMLYGFLMLAQGGALRFRPLIIGAIINWLGALAIFLNRDFQYDMLISAAAVFAGYIIPGLLLRKATRANRLNDGI